MKLLEAISYADSLRPNALDDKLKSMWIWELESEIAELMDVELPENTFPEDCELLMPSPKDSIYYLFLMAKIDLAVEDTSLYVNDMTVYNSAVLDAKKWWRRHHEKKSQQYIRAFPWQPPVKGEEEDVTRTPDEDTTETSTEL